MVVTVGWLGNESRGRISVYYLVYVTFSSPFVDIKGRFTRCFGYSCVTITDSGGVGYWFPVGRARMV